VKAPRIVAFGDSDKGRARTNNEDRFLCEQELGVFAVIDGVGGESAGEEAAGIAVDSLRKRLSRRTTETRQLLREAIALANAQIYERAQQNPQWKGMSCVLTAAVLDGDRITIGHVGDSRLYLLRRGGIEKVTRDHSPIGVREDRGEISEAEAMQHPRRNEILRDVGSAPHQPDDPDFIDFYERAFEPDAALLLCSDGLSDMLTSEEMRTLTERHAGNPQAAVEELIDAANEKGGKDNISVVLVEGERFAQGLREGGSKAPRRTAAAGGPAAPPAAAWRDEPSIPMKGDPPAPRPVALQGAASLPRRPFPWLPVVVGGIVALAVALGYFYRIPLARWWAARSGGGEAPAADLLVRAPASIQEAIDRAAPGDTVEVLPGEYIGPIRLRDGVSLLCRTPRGAVIRADRQGPVPEVLVSAEGLHRAALLSGFRIDGGGAVRAGLSLDGSEIEVGGLEIVGAEAGVVVSGPSHPALEGSYLHGNRTAGVLLRDGASPRLSGNLISRNAGAGVEVCETCRPWLADNRILENGGPPIRLLATGAAAAALADELWGWNSFGALPRERAVASAGTRP
jgi:serine/threonine protein phosphatase PrpC